MWRTFRCLTAYVKTDNKLRSEDTTRFAILRWTNNSPRSTPVRSVMETRESEQPMYKKSGDWPLANFGKYSGSLSFIFFTHLAFEWKSFSSAGSSFLFGGWDWSSLEDVKNRQEFRRKPSICPGANLLSMRSVDSLIELRTAYLQ